MRDEEEGGAGPTTAREETLERARAIGREIKEALGRAGFRAGSAVRTWSSSNVEVLRRLPRSSAILGVTILEGGRAAEAAPHVSGYGAEVVLVGEGVIVLEVAEQ